MQSLNSTRPEDRITAPRNGPRDRPSIFKGAADRRSSGLSPFYVQTLGTQKPNASLPPMFLYSYADLTLSSDLSLPELERAPGIRNPGGADVSFTTSESVLTEPRALDWIHHWYAQEENPILSVARRGKDYLLRFPALADFAVSTDGRAVVTRSEPETTGATLRHLLLDQVLPRVLGHRGRLVLHASSVRFPAGVVGFVGDTGWGKSTLAASFHEAGLPFLGDDGLVLTDGSTTDGSTGTRAVPTYPGLRLSSRSMSALSLENLGGALMAEYSGKRRVSVPSTQRGEVMALAALFMLAPPSGPGGEDSVTVRRLSPRDACMEMVRHSFRLDVTDQKNTAHLLSAAARTAEDIPAFLIRFPRDFSSLRDVQAAVLEKVGDV